MILTAEQFERITKNLKSERSRSDERRGKPRVSLSGSMEVIQIVASDQPVVPFKARLRDFSSTGIGLLASGPLPKGCRLVVILPPGDSEYGGLLCEVVRQQTVSGGSVQVGAAFIERLTTSSITHFRAGNLHELARLLGKSQAA